MRQTDMLKAPIRSVFFSYLAPSVSATLVTSIYILADTMMIGRGVGASGIAALNLLLPLQRILWIRNDVRSRRQRSFWLFQRKGRRGSGEGIFYDGASFGRFIGGGQHRPLRGLF